jgi:hypothetical protein
MHLKTEIPTVRFLMSSRIYAPFAVRFLTVREFERVVQVTTSPRLYTISEIRSAAPLSVQICAC